MSILLMVGLGFGLGLSCAPSSKRSLTWEARPDSTMLRTLEDQARRDSSDAAAWVRLGAAEYRSGRSDVAVELLTRARNLGAEGDAARFFLARSLESASENTLESRWVKALGDSVPAFNEWRRSIELAESLTLAREERETALSSPSVYRTVQPVLVPDFWIESPNSSNSSNAHVRPSARNSSKEPSPVDAYLAEISALLADDVLIEFWAAERSRRGKAGERVMTVPLDAMRSPLGRAREESALLTRAVRKLQQHSQREDTPEAVFEEAPVVTPEFGSLRTEEGVLSRLQWLSDPSTGEPFFAGDVDLASAQELRAAVRRFQLANGLNGDGVCGPGTRRALSQAVDRVTAASKAVAAIPAPLRQRAEAVFARTDAEAILQGVLSHEAGNLRAQWFWIERSRASRLGDPFVLPVDDLDTLVRTLQGELLARPTVRERLWNSFAKPQAAQPELAAEELPGVWGPERNAERLLAIRARRAELEGGDATEAYRALHLHRPNDPIALAGYARVSGERPTLEPYEAELWAQLGESFPGGSPSPFASPRGVQSDPLRASRFVDEVAASLCPGPLPDRPDAPVDPREDHLGSDAVDEWIGLSDRVTQPGIGDFPDPPGTLR